MDIYKIFMHAIGIEYPQLPAGLQGMLVGTVYVYTKPDTSLRAAYASKMQNAVGVSMGNQILHHIYCTSTISSSKSLLLMLHCKVKYKCGCQGAEPEDRGAHMLHMHISARNIFAGTAEDDFFQDSVRCFTP